jgi:nucleotide-binding universal stress UspA family protein
MDMNTTHENPFTDPSAGTNELAGASPLSTAPAPLLAQALAPLIWALEAFPDHDDLHLKTAAALGRMYPRRQVIPVYVLSEESFTDRGFSTFLKPSLKPMAKKALARLLSEIRALKLIENIRRPRVLIEASASRPACAKKLLRFAQKIGASEIAVGSHAKNGLARLFVGSFSEAMLDESRIPVLVTGPHADISASAIRSVVFPTDFSSACTTALPRILELCSQLGAELHILHKPIQIFDTYIQSGVGLFGGSWVNIDELMVETFEDHLADSRVWLDQAGAFGVKTTFVGENFREPTAEAIVTYADRLGAGTTLIAMVSQSTRATSAFLGSVTRDVIRASRCPIYVAPRAG